MYKFIFKKDNFFIFTKDIIREEMEINREVNLLLLILVTMLDLITLPFQIIISISLIKEE